jgi:RNA polymerase sigma factor (sigma-70 family)
LLAAYGREQSDAAFQEISHRYRDMVYSAAYRQTGNAATAEDITQAVFIILSRKARSLSPNTVLSGWLFRAVRYAAMDALKMESRRQRRESECISIESESAESWEQLAPLLDEGLAGLSERDRRGILLRFFEKKGWSEIGALLGLDENAARVRVTRALEKLRLWFGRRGVSVPVTVLGSLLLANAVQAAPAAAAAGASAAAQTLAGFIARQYLVKKLVLAGLGAVLLALLGGGGFWLNGRMDAQRAAQRASDQRAIDRVIVGIDGTYANNDLNGFLALIHFRPGDERYRPVLLEYARAAGAFRRELRARFPSIPLRSDAFNATIDDLFRGQPRPARNYLEGDRAGSARFRRCTIELIRVEGAWKWDYFRALNPAQAQEQILFLQRRTQLLNELTQRILNYEAWSGRELVEIVAQQQ